MTTTPPNLTDYLSFLRELVGITVGNLPDDAPVITTTFNVAMALVNEALLVAGCDVYSFAVYNLATDRLINYAIDVSGQTYFADLRKSFGVFNRTPGVVSSTSDQGSSSSYLNPEFMKTLTLSDLQTLKTPYGRAYIGIAQDFGPVAWGVT